MTWHKFNVEIFGRNPLEKERKIKKQVCYQQHFLCRFLFYLPIHIYKKPLRVNLTVRVNKTLNLKNASARLRMQYLHCQWVIASTDLTFLTLTICNFEGQNRCKNAHKESSFLFITYTDVIPGIMLTHAANLDCTRPLKQYRSIYYRPQTKFGVR